MLTESRISDIRARCESATPGPWNYDCGFIITTLLDEAPRSTDREFIAHSRQDIPDLLAEIEQLKEDVRRRDFMIGNGLGWEDLENNCL